MKMRKKISFLAALLVIFLSVLTEKSRVLAIDCSRSEVTTDLGCIPTDPVGFSSRLYGIGLGLIGGVALLAIIYGGYLILSSQGEPGQLQKGKSYIYSAITGIVLALLGYALYQVLATRVIKLPGFE